MSLMLTGLVLASQLGNVAAGWGGNNDNDNNDPWNDDESNDATVEPTEEVADPCDGCTGTCIWGMCFGESDDDSTSSYTSGGVWDALEEDCRPPCSSSETCSAGFCVLSDDPCNGACAEGESCVPDESSRNDDYVCWGEDSDCTDCESEDQWCNFGVCSEWVSGLDTRWQDMFRNTDLDSNGMGNFTTFSSDSLPEDGRISAMSGDVISFDENVTDITEVRFGCDDLVEDCNTTTGSFFVERGMDITIEGFVAEMGAVGMFIGRDSITRISSTEVTSNSTLTISSEEGSTAYLDDVLLADSATAIISGNGSTQLFSSSANNASSRYALNGGGAISGSTGQSTVEISATWEYSADINVENLSSAGNWIGIGNVNVRGEFNISGPGMQPYLNIENGANCTIDTALFLGDHTNISGGLRLRDNGGNSHFTKIEGCGDEGIITLEVDELDNLTFGERFTVFTYGSDTNTSNFTCTLQITDKDGDVLDVVIGQPPTSTDTDTDTDTAATTAPTVAPTVAPTIAPTEPARRRLFSVDSANDCVYGEWTEEELAMTSGECDGNTNSNTDNTDANTDTDPNTADPTDPTNTADPTDPTDPDPTTEVESTEQPTAPPSVGDALALDAAGIISPAVVMTAGVILMALL